MTELVRTPFGPKATATQVLEGVDLHGRTHLVTGGASGIGLETVRALAAAGADVVDGWDGPLHGFVATADVLLAVGVADRWAE